MCWKSPSFLPQEKGESNMKNLDKYLTLLGEEVDGLLLTSR